MANQLTEQQVLNKLGIPDFRHLSKNNVMQFASILNEMDPAVAVKALEQWIFEKRGTFADPEIVKKWHDIFWPNMLTMKRTPYLLLGNSEKRNR